MELQRLSEIGPQKAGGLFARAAGRRVLFITTKNVDYIRNAQEITALRRAGADVTVLGGMGRSYPARLAKVWGRLLCMPLRRYDLIFVGFAPQLVLPFFAWRFHGQEVWEDFFISLWDTLVDDRKKLRPGSMPARLLWWIDRRTLAYAGRVVADTRADADWFAETFGIAREKFEVCYLEADPAVYFPRPAPAKSDGRFVVLYFAGMLPLQGVETVLRCARLMAGENVIFDLIGPLPDRLRQTYGTLPDLCLTTWLPQRELAERIAKADLCLAGHFDPVIGKAARTIPGKAFICRAMARPVVLGDSPANRELFHADENTCFVPRGDPGTLAECIRARMTGARPEKEGDAR